jgi:ATP-dependent DNA helicase DinG
MIEAKSHSYLHNFLKQQTNISIWQHHLTMARLVARALRVGKSALIQTGISLENSHIRYRLSYLISVLLWTEPVILVASESAQKSLLSVDIPQLKSWLGIDKEIIQYSPLHPPKSWEGLILVTPQVWLADKFSKTASILPEIITIIDGVEDLEELTREQLTISITSKDWDSLMLAFFQQKSLIFEHKVKLTKEIFKHPVNPYNCYLLTEPCQDILQEIFTIINQEELAAIPPLIREDGQYREEKEYEKWHEFARNWREKNQILWVKIDRETGQFYLYSSIVEVATALSKIWAKQPIVLIGSMLDQAPKAEFFRQQIGLEDITCLQFSSDRQNESIQLYIPDNIPLPNTPEFQVKLLEKLQELINFIGHINRDKTIVIIVGDTPLKAQIAALLAGEFGSRVQVEKTQIEPGGILITGWEFWHNNQRSITTPYLLAIATLPIPSLENPLVAAMVKHYKQNKKDWFRLYLLPTGLRELQKAIAPIRETEGIVAILDLRVNNRSYGKQVLSVLSPFARINYLQGLTINEQW